MPAYALMRMLKPEGRIDVCAVQVGEWVTSDLMIHRYVCGAMFVRHPRCCYWIEALDAPALRRLSEDHLVLGEN